jgi:hypothetical protein
MIFSHHAKRRAIRPHDRRKWTGSAGGISKPGDSDLTCDRAIVSVTSQPDVDSQCAALLLRAAALFDLVEAGVYSPLEAFDRLTPAWSALACGCGRQFLRACEEYDKRLRELRLRTWRWHR